MYIIYEKTYIERLGKKIDNETNIGHSESIDGIINYIEKVRDIKLSRRTIFNAIKSKKPIYDKYFIYKLKE